jgi:hypothetical protein
VIRAFVFVAVVAAGPILACAGAEPAPATPCASASALPTPLPSAATPPIAASTAPPPITPAAPTASAIASAAPVLSASASVSIATTPPAGPADPPIPSTPLAGTLDGRPFEAKSALAIKDPDDPTRRRVYVFDRAVTCAPKLPPAGVRVVEFSVPWESNTAFGFESMSGGAHRAFTSVRGEILEANASSARISVRVRSNAMEVAGELRVSVCP